MARGYCICCICVLSTCFLAWSLLQGFSVYHPPHQHFLEGTVRTKYTSGKNGNERFSTYDLWLFSIVTYCTPCYILNLSPHKDKQCICFTETYSGGKTYWFAVCSLSTIKAGLFWHSCVYALVLLGVSKVSVPQFNTRRMPSEHCPLSERQTKRKRAAGSGRGLCLCVHTHFCYWSLKLGYVWAAKHKWVEFFEGIVQFILAFILTEQWNAEVECCCESLLTLYPSLCQKQNP